MSESKAKAISRRSAIAGMVALSAAATARTFHVDKNCRDMAVWRLSLGKCKLKIPTRYRPFIDQRAMVQRGYFGRLLFSPSEDSSSVKYCQKPFDAWLNVDDISVDREGLKPFRENAKLRDDQDGVERIILEESKGQPGWTPWHWMDGPVPGFLSDVPKSGGLGVFLLSKEKLLRGGQAWGIRASSKGGLILPTRMNVRISAGLNISTDSMGFTLRGIEGLKADLKVVEMFLKAVVIR